MIIELTKKSFNKEVLESDLPVLVDFWASWCGPCQRMAPILEALDLEIEGFAKVTKVEVDEEYELADQYEILSIPTIAVFLNGQIVKTLIGVQSKDTLKKALGL